MSGRNHIATGTSAQLCRPHVIDALLERISVGLRLRLCPLVEAEGNLFDCLLGCFHEDGGIVAHSVPSRAHSGLPRGRSWKNHIDLNVRTTGSLRIQRPFRGRVLHKGPLGRHGMTNLQVGPRTEMRIDDLRV